MIIITWRIGAIAPVNRVKYPVCNRIVAAMKKKSE